MTIGEIITLIDTLKPNQFSWNNKVMWLSELDGMVRKWVETEERIATSPSAPRNDSEETDEDDSDETDESDESEEDPIADMGVEPYGWRETGSSQQETVNQTELYIPEPWAVDIYLNYLRAQIDLANGETEKYQLHNAVYRNLLDGFEQKYAKEIVGTGTVKKGWRF